MPPEVTAASARTGVTDAITSPLPIYSRQSPRPDPKYGTGTFVVPSKPSRLDGGEGAAGQTQQFQYRDAPIDLVLNQVLGVAFGLSYAIDPSIQGKVTVRLDGLTDGASAVAALDAALRLQGIKVAPAGDGYLISRVDAAGGGSGNFQILASPDDQPTGDAAVLILKHANPDEVVRLATPLLATGVVKLSDPLRGMLVLQGSNQQVSAAVDALRAFDVDWFSATSSISIELRATSPEDIKKELDQIFGRTGGVEVVALTRLGAIMIFARSKDLLDRAVSATTDLDRVGRGAIQNNTLIYEAKYVSAERLQGVAAALFQLSPNGGGSGGDKSGSAQAAPNASAANISIAIDAPSNLVVAQGHPDNLLRIQEVFERVDRPQKQVLIEATIVEVALRGEFRFGIQWEGVTDFLDITLADNSSGSAASKFPGLSVVYANTDITSVLNALDTKTDVQVVSSPRVLALNNQPSRIQVGDQVPIVTQSAVSVTDPAAPIVNSTSYRDTGIILEVTPYVRAGDFVEIKIAQEVSDVSETVTSGIDSPTISTRRMEGVLAVPNGATVALGGLITSNRSKSVSGIPIVKDIPLVGGLFSSQVDIERSTELVVLLRPTILNPEAPELDITSKLVQALDRVRPEWLSRP